MEAHPRTESRRSRCGRRRFVLLMLAAAITTAGARAEEGARAYRMSPTSGPGTVARLRAELHPDHFATFLAVNRVDTRHAGSLDSLVLPPEGRSLLELTPFPSRLAAGGSLPSLLVISARVQAFAAYDSGRLVRWGPVSTGGPASPTLAREYRANWKARRHVSTFDTTLVMPWCVNLDDAVGTALHAYALTGRPASHCCIRLLEPDARWIHDWIVVGMTPVFVLDAYDFDAPPPWRRLPVDPAACDVARELVESAIAPRGLPAAD